MPLTQVSGAGLADNSVNAAKIATGAVTVADIPNGEITGEKLHSTVDLPDAATAHTQTAGTNNTTIATTAFVTTAVGNISQDSMTEGDTKAEVVDTGSDGHFLVETEGTERLRVIADGKVGIGTSTPTCELDITGTGAIQVPVGTTAQRPTAEAGNNGMLRYNSTTNQFEGCIDGSFASLAPEKLDVISAGTITGDAAPGETLTATNPTVAGGDGNYSFSYQWQVAASGSSSFSAITGATSSTLTVASTYNSNDAVGQTLRCVVTASDGGSATSVGVASNEKEIVVLYQANTWPAGLLYRFTPDNVSSSVSSMTETQVTINGSATTKVVSWMMGSAPITFGAVTEDGLFYYNGTDPNNSSFATDLPTRATGFERSGRTIRQVVGENSGLEYKYILYDNGSIWYTNNNTSLTITELHSDSAAATNPCTTLWGCMYYSGSTGGGVFEDGTMMLFKGVNNNGGSAGGTFHTFVNPLPSGVKVKDVVMTGVANNSTREVQALLILGDDGDVYSVGNNSYAVDTVTAGTLTAGGAAKASSFGDIIAICGNAGNGSSWSGDHGAGETAWILRSNNTLYYTNSSSSWTQVGTDTDYLTTPWVNGHGNAMCLSTTANTVKWVRHGSDHGDVTISSGNQDGWPSKIGPTSLTNGFQDRSHIIIPD